MFVLLIVVFFISTLIIEAYHDSVKRLVKWDCSEYEFVLDRKTKAIKMIGLFYATCVLAYIAGDWNLVWYYLLARVTLFHPIYRLFVNSWGFVFSINGVKYMIKHSEMMYWYEIIFKGRR